MNELANQLVQSLFKKNSLQECSKWELEILANKYPYFGVAQLLLAAKLKEDNPEDYKKQAQKTSLYFSNSLWLDYTLNNIFEDNATEVSEEVAQLAQKSGEQEIKQEETFKNTESFTETDIAQTLGVATINEIPSTNINIEDATSDEEINLPEIKIAPFKTEPLFSSSATITIEALHTTDYFASQGIKLKLEDMPKDKFGQQLKSFTEWLKTLKKSPPIEFSKQIDINAEQKVISLAEHSIENQDVLTEAMADIWIKQGNKEKALDVYNKLSLQNPSKSAYFETLINDLNK